MTPNEGTDINVGAAVRDGLRLTTVEVVALLHNACLQVDAGTATALPTSIDNLWVTDAGTVALPPVARVEPARATVGLLLETLLPPANDAGGDSVPPSLRTLPARLRESTSKSDASELKDLLAILRWHLPYDSSEVLRDFVARARLATAALPAAAVIDMFTDEGAAPLPAATAIEPAATAIEPVTARTAPTTASASTSANTSANEAVIRPATRMTDRPRSPDASPRRLAIAAAVVLAVGGAGFAGYRFSALDRDVTSEAPVDAPAAAVPLPGRITRADEPPPAPSAASSRAPRLASNPRPLELAVNGGAFSPSFDSAGRALVFHAGRNATGRLFHASLDERGSPSTVTPLLEERGRTYHARLSPDGIWVAFDSDRDGERGVYLASRNGLHVARVSGDGFAAVPSWSPDMKWLAFVRAEPGRPKVWNLWLRDVETGELTRKSAFRSGQVWGASWFPGSRSIAYSHEDRLIISETDSSAAKTFRSPIAGRLVRTPAVSPDGSRIVFQVYRDGAWLLDLKTGAMTRLLDDRSAEEFAWDPDGRQIAYHSRRDGEWRIWLLTIEPHASAPEAP